MASAYTAASSKQQAASSKQQAASSKQQAASSKQSKIRLLNTSVFTIEYCTTQSMPHTGHAFFIAGPGKGRITLLV